MKKRKTWIVLALVGCIAAGYSFWKNKEEAKEKELLEKRKMELLKSFILEENMEKDKKKKEEIFLHLETKDIERFIPEMSGFTNNGEGAFTIMKKISENNQERFPQKEGTLLFIPNCNLIEDGALVEITDILDNDTVVMYKFKVMNPFETLEMMTLKMDSMLQGLENNSKKD